MSIALAYVDYEMLFNAVTSTHEGHLRIRQWNKKWIALHDPADPHQQPEYIVLSRSISVVDALDEFSSHLQSRGYAPIEYLDFSQLSMRQVPNKQTNE